MLHKETLSQKEKKKMDFSRKKRQQICSAYKMTDNGNCQEKSGMTVILEKKDKHKNNWQQ